MEKNIFKNKYLLTALAMYLVYFVHGMGGIILAQNKTALMAQWATDAAGIGMVISALGLGRFIVLFISGKLSDKYGRKPFILIGIVTYITFFVGILFSKNVTVAFIFGLLAGMANSFLDAGTYPALMECFEEAQGSASVMIKAFISGGSSLLPIIISFLIANNMYYGYSFFFCIAVLVLCGLVLLKVPFPAFKAVEAEGAKEVVEIKDVPKSNMWIEGIALIVIGFTATSTFQIIASWLPTYAQGAAGMQEASANMLISLYSTGSLLSVFVTSALVAKWIKQVRFVFVYPLISLIMLVILWMFPSVLVCKIAAVVIGFTAAGGVLQLALTSMAELFPVNKGTITGLVYSASSISSFIIPAVCGKLADINVGHIILLDIVITAVGVILALVVNFRYNRVMKKA
ncbi:MFS transporter [Cellulosilyticum sp. ST5]|uniref:MFS transporter n=1 Tax=unclassified Cellulosilyticum TaxID=2643091 RepID=UPI000F8F61DC|nr:MFS transporter [Cellulosilyticum sp. WCF-2]QEH67966.1 MFS transporter [Cellulosilyticum sp. WCF-2]